MNEGINYFLNDTLPFIIFILNLYPSDGPCIHHEARAFLHDPHVLVVHRPVDELDSGLVTDQGDQGYQCHLEVYMAYVRPPFDS